MKQKFIPVQLRHGRAIATREYFLRKFHTAVRQRSRWVTGIALQSWEFHTFEDTLRQGYWFWRDRKSAVANLITPLTNVLFVIGAGTWGWAQLNHHAWLLARELSRHADVYTAGLALMARY